MMMTGVVTKTSMEMGQHSGIEHRNMSRMSVSWLIFSVSVSSVIDSFKAVYISVLEVKVKQLRT